MLDDTAYSAAWNGVIDKGPTQNAVYDALQSFQPLDTELTSLAALVPAGNALKVVRVNAGATGFELATLAAGGNVSNSGTPTTGQLARWTNATTIEGIAADASAVGLGNVTNNAQTQAAIVPNTAPTAGQILIGNAGGTAYAKNSITGSGATIALGATGVLTISAIANASLVNSAITIAGTSTALGGSITRDTILGLSSVGLVTRTAANTLSTITDASANWNTAFTQTRQWDTANGISGTGTAAQGRTALGATVAGGNLFTLPTPGGDVWLKVNALGAVVAENAATTRTSLGLVVGTNVQAWDAQLDSLALLAYAGNALKVVRVNAGETGFELATVSAGGGGTWGSITGTLSDQTDLQTALDAKQPLDAELTSLAALVPSGNGLKVVRVNSGGTGFELATISAGGVDNFLALTDTPDDYTGQGSKLVAVKADVTGLEFITPAGGGNVSNSGTPSADQLAMWVSATSIKGVSISGSGATISLSNTGVLTISGIANASLANSSITIAGTAVSLGGSITRDTILGVTATTVGLNFLDLANPVRLAFQRSLLAMTWWLRAQRRSRPVSPSQPLTLVLAMSRITRRRSPASCQTLRQLLVASQLATLVALPTHQ